jgi:hypothetical protein
MATYDNVGSGGALGGGRAYVVLNKATQNPPCGCCRNVCCVDSINDSGLLPFPLPETWTVTIPSPNTTCCAFNQTFELFYTGTLYQVANQNQPGIVAGCFPSWSFEHNCPGPNGFFAGSFVLQQLGPPSWPAGTIAATFGMGSGFQNITWQSLHFQDGTMELPNLIGTSSSCSTNFGGSWSDTLDPTHTAFPVFDFQTVRHPCTPSTASPNGAWIITYSPGFPGNGNTVFNTFTYDTTTGDFSGSNGSISGGTFSGNFNFTTGQIVVTSAGTLFTGTQRIQVQVEYSTPSDYPPIVTMVPHGTLDCPSCSDDGPICASFILFVEKDVAVAGGPTITKGRYTLNLVDGYVDVAGSGYTSVGCGVYQWNSNHQTGQVELRLTPGNLSYGINPTVAEISPTGHTSRQDFGDCLWTSYMDWDVPTDDGMPHCDCPTQIADGMWFMPYLGINPGDTRTIWKPRTGGGAIGGGTADVEYIKAPTP